MPAPSIAALRDHESQICRAARAVLTAGGFADPRTPGGVAVVPDAMTTIKFVRGDATGDQGVRGTAAQPATARIDYNRWTGTLEIMCAIRAADNTPSAIDGLDRVLGERRGLIRALFLKSAHPFTLALLPWLAVNDIMPLAGDEGVDERRNLNVIVERFRLTYEELPSAWPVA